MVGESGAAPVSAAQRARRVLNAAFPFIFLGLIAVIDFPICPMRLSVGVPCPGCGLTRACVAAMQLDLHTMLHFHPLAPIFGPLVAWTFGIPLLQEAGLLEKGGRLDRLRMPQAFWYVVAVLLFGVWIARLLGFLGGHPDPIDLHDTIFYRLYAFIAS